MLSTDGAGRNFMNVDVAQYGGPGAVIGPLPPTKKMTKAIAMSSAGAYFKGVLLSLGGSGLWQF